MKVTKALLSGLALLTGLAVASAQDNLRVVLKDGSELTGYISRQRPGENFTLTTSEATIILPAGKVRSIIDNEVALSSLSPQWQQWAEENNAYSGSGNDRKLLLSDIVTDNGSVNRVRVLEKGAKVRYLEIAANSYSLKWDTIQVIRADRRPRLLLSGVNRRYRLASEKDFEGQYIEEVPGQTVSLLGANGVIQVFNTGDVLQDSRIAVNPNQSLLEQSDLIDIINLTSGGPYRGIIFERNYSPDNDFSKDYLRILLEDGSTMSVPMSNVEEYRKEKNPAYKPFTDIILDEGRGAVNRQTGVMTPASEIPGGIAVYADSVSIIIPSADLPEITAEFNLDNASASRLRLVKIRKMQPKKSKTPFFGFTFEDLVKNSLAPRDVATSVNGTSRLQFTLPSNARGLYGVYDSQSGRILVFRIVDR